jgi:hypothetical protein
VDSNGKKTLKFISVLQICTVFLSFTSVKDLYCAAHYGFFTNLQTRKLTVFYVPVIIRIFTVE